MPPNVINLIVTVSRVEKQVMKSDSNEEVGAANPELLPYQDSDEETPQSNFTSRTNRPSPCISIYLKKTTLHNNNICGILPHKK